MDFARDREKLLVISMMLAMLAGAFYSAAFFAPRPLLYVGALILSAMFVCILRANE